MTKPAQLRPRRLSILRLRNFRSVGEEGVEVPFGRRLTLMYGENGAGKSTIIRALRLLEDLPALVRGLDEEDRRDFDATIPCEIEAIFEGTGRPMLSGEWVEVPIRRIALRWEGEIDGEERRTVTVETVDGVAKCWGSDDGQIFWSGREGGHQADRRELDLEGEKNPEALTSRLDSKDPMEVLRCCLFLGGIGAATQLGGDSDFSFKTGSLYSLPTGIVLTPPFGSRGSGRYHPTAHVLPVALDLQIAFMDTLQILWTETLPSSPSLEVDLLPYGREEATQLETKLAQEAWDDALSDYSEDDDIPPRPTRVEAMPFSVLRLRWPTKGGRPRSNDAHSTGEKRVFLMLLGAMVSRYQPTDTSEDSIWRDASAFGPLVLEEPEVHLHTVTQGRLLRSLLSIEEISQTAFQDRYEVATSLAKKLEGWEAMAHRFPVGLRPLVIETHSEAFLQATLDLVERGKLDPTEDLSLLSLTRDEGSTFVHRLPVSPSGFIQCAWPGAYPGGQSGVEGA